MKKLLICSACAFAVFSMAPIVHAEDAPAKVHAEKAERYKKMFEKTDTDGNGVISKEEFLSHAEEKFAKLDADGDGSVTHEEMKAMKEKMREKHKNKHKEVAE